MSKCRYNLSEDCNSRDCVECVLDKIRSEIANRRFGVACDGVLTGIKYERQSVIEIIDKYRAESNVVNSKEKQLLDELSKMPPMVIVTAYLYAINYIQYGEDVTEKWVTAVEQASALEKAYRKGYYAALERNNRMKDFVLQESSEDK